MSDLKREALERAAIVWAKGWEAKHGVPPFREPQRNPAHSVIAAAILRARADEAEWWMEHGWVSFDHTIKVEARAAELRTAADELEADNGQR